MTARKILANFSCVLYLENKKSKWGYPAQSIHLGNHSLPVYSSTLGHLMKTFGLAIQVEDNKHHTFYIKTNDVIRALVSPNAHLNYSQVKRIKQRILEITDTDTRNPVSCEKLTKIFSEFKQDQAQTP